MVNALLPLGQTLGDITLKLTDILNIFTSVYDGASHTVRTESKIDSCVLESLQPQLVVTGSVLANVNDPIDVKVIESVGIGITGDVGVKQPLTVEWSEPMPVKVSEQPLYVQWDAALPVSLEQPVETKIVNATAIPVSFDQPVDVIVKNPAPIPVDVTNPISVSGTVPVHVNDQPLQVRGEVKVTSDGPLDVKVINEVEVKNTALGSLLVTVEGGDIDVHGDVGTNFNILGGGQLQMDAYIAEVVGAIGGAASAITGSIGGVVTAENATTTAVGSTTAAVVAASAAITGIISSTGHTAHSDALDLLSFESNPVVPIVYASQGNDSRFLVGSRVSDIDRHFDEGAAVTAPVTLVQPSDLHYLGDARILTSSYRGNGYGLDIANL